MATLLRVLFVDDSEDDVALVLLDLSRGGYEPEYIRVDTAKAMATALTTRHWDIVICDYSMPKFSGPAALELLQESGLDLPFILVSGNVSDETGALVMTAGANDFIEKGRANRLLPIVERELQGARERTERRKAAEALEKYMSPKVYDLIQRTDLRMGGESREITVLKTDIRDFTALAEGKEPEELIEFLNRYFTRMVEVVHRYEGEVDKFMGDAILVKFGATEWYPDHAERAVRTMIDMIEACDALSQELEQEGAERIRMGIGCDTGAAVVGNVGSPDRMEYTVVSSNVNAAQRIEELCKEFGWDLLIGESTYEQAKKVAEVGEPVRTRLRGQSHDTLVYPLLGLRGAVTPERRAAYKALRSLGWLSPAAREETIPEVRFSL